MITISDAPSRAMALMHRIVPQRLEYQISLLVALLVAACIFFLTLHVADEQAESATDAASVQAMALVRNIAAISGAHIERKDIAALNSMLMRIARFPGVEEIVVTDKSGVVLSQVNTTPSHRPHVMAANTVLTLPTRDQPTVDETDKILTVWHAVQSDRPLGWIKLSQSLKFIDAMKTEIWLNTLGHGAIAILIATLVLLLFLRRPMRSIFTNITRLKDIETHLRTSESRLLQTQSVGHIGSWEWYIGSNDMYWSKQVWDIFDVPPTDFKPTYDGFLATIHPDDLKGVSNAFSACIKCGKKYDQEFRIVTPSGETRWLQVWGDALCDPSGQTEKLLGVVQDISSRKTADLAVEEMRAQLERLLKNSPTVIYSMPSIHSPHPDYISANIRTLLGYNAQDVIDHDDFWAAHIHPDDLHVLKNIHEELPHMMTERFVYRMQHKHGDYVWLQDSRRITKSSQDNADMVVGTLTNITELKKTQGQLDRRNIELETLRRSLAWKVKLRTAELEEANKELQKLNQVKSEFISTVSHELRTPLTSIKSFAEILLDNDEGMDIQTKTNFLSIILQETDRLSRLVSNVLDLQKIDAGKTDWHDKLVDIGAIVHSTAKMFNAPFHRNGVKLVHTAGKSISTVVDADKIRQVLMNLLSNALKFTYEGKVEITARILPAPGWGEPGEGTEAAHTETIEISVTDSGCGIPESDISNIFDRFYQSDHHSACMSEGTGLGLTICQEIIRHYGGDLWVTSKIDEGSTFTFTLPIYNRLTNPDVTNPNLRGLLYQKEIDELVNHRTH